MGPPDGRHCPSGVRAVAVRIVRSDRTPWVAVLLPLAWFLYTGNRGIDFGWQWDQSLLLTDIQTSLQTRLLLPTGVCNYPGPGLAGGHYEYPSLLYWVGMACAAPEVLRDGLDPAVPQPTGFVQSPAFGLRLRRACLALSSLAIVWTFGLAWRITGRWPLALLAACLLGGSWEVAYHARFVAPDAIAMQFTALCLMLCVTAVTGGVRPWRSTALAAVAAGVATATKYPAAVTLVPVLTAGWMVPTGRRAMRLIAVFTIAAAAFAVVTPGALLQPWNLAAWLRVDRAHYGQWGHAGWTIRSHAAHLLAMLDYLGLVLFSRLPVIACATVALASVGAASLVRHKPAVALVLLPLPALYVGYFDAQVVMIVRNLLLVAPPLAVLAAVGTGAVLDRVGRRPVVRWTLLAAVTVGVAANAGWLITSSRSPRERAEPSRQLAAARAYLAAHPRLRPLADPPLAAELGIATDPSPAAGRTDVVLAWVRTGQGRPEQWPANRRGQFRQTFGAAEVNPDYYPSFNTDRLVLVDVADARRVPLPQVERPLRRRDLLAAAPAGFTLGPYVDGGYATPPVDGVTATLVRGHQVERFVEPGTDLADDATSAEDADRVTYELTGLDPARAYRVGWTAWDRDGGGRIQSVCAQPPGTAAAEALTPPSPLPPWPGPVRRTTAPLPRSAYRTGEVRISFVRVAGPDATVTGFWVWVATAAH